MQWKFSNKLSDSRLVERGDYGYEDDYRNSREYQEAEYDYLKDEIYYNKPEVIDELWDVIANHYSEYDWEKSLEKGELLKGKSPESIDDYSDEARRAYENLIWEDSEFFDRFLKTYFGLGKYKIINWPDGKECHFDLNLSPREIKVLFDILKEKF